MTKKELINEIKSVVMNNGGEVKHGQIRFFINENGDVMVDHCTGRGKNINYESKAQLEIDIDVVKMFVEKYYNTEVETVETEVENNTEKNMKEEKIASKLEDFLLDFDYLEGFTTYRAYCYVFDLDYDWNIHYDEHNRVNIKDMSFDDFGTWLMFYMFDNKSEDFIGVDIAECNDCVYIRK